MAEPSSSRTSLSRLVGALGGDRFRRAVDRRVRRQVRRELAGDGAARATIREIVAEETAGLRDAQSQRSARDFTLRMMLGGSVRGNRTLHPNRFATLHDEICALTGVDDVEWKLVQAFRSLLDAEERGLGRIAGTPYNILGKLVTPPLLAPPPGPILEIGTLYGLFSPSLVRSFRRAGDFRHLTVVDPFVGLQHQEGANLQQDRTGTPVTQQTAEANFAELGLGADDVRVVKGFSTDPDVRAAAGDRAYAVVVIDGDHGQEGVEKDLWWVETILAPGGLAVMDDFGDQTWPGVEAATRTYLAAGGKMELLGTVATSAYLRMPS